MHFNRFDLNLLVALEALLRERHVTRAAESLFVSQSAMSAALQRLREKFDDPLLVRVGRKMELTPLALALREPVTELLLQAEKTLETKQEFDPATSRRSFTVMMSSVVSSVFMPEIVKRLAASAPGITIHLEPMRTDVDRLLNAGSVNLAVRALVSEQEKSNTDESLVCAGFYKDPWVCVADAAHPTLGEALSLDEFLELPHVLLNFGNSVQTIPQRVIEKYAFDLNVLATASTFSSLVFMVPGTPVLTMVSKTMAEKMNEFLSLKIYTPPFAIPDIEEVMFWHKRDMADSGHIWLRELFLEVARDMGLSPQ